MLRGFPQSSRDPTPPPPPPPPPPPSPPSMATTEISSSFSKRKFLLIINVVLLAVGDIGSPLIMRLYFVNGGKRIWLSAWLETAGWPFMFVPLLVSYFHRRRKEGPNARVVFITQRVFAFSAALGIITGLDNFFYTGGVARLPVSTTTLIFATQLGFCALFGYFLVNQKLTPYSINAIVLLTTGAGVLALNRSSDRPKGVSEKGYILGYLMSLSGSILYGIMLPLIELTYKKAKQAITYTLVMEIQLVMCFFATAFCTVGMLINRDFQAIGSEASNFDLGEKLYYVVLLWTLITWQMFFLGAVGIIFCASSLLTGILICVCLPVTEILGVFIYHENFKVEKAISFGLCLWGFISYFYGEFRQKKEEEKLAAAAAAAIVQESEKEMVEQVNIVV